MAYINVCVSVCTCVYMAHRTHANTHIICFDGMVIISVVFFYFFKKCTIILTKKKPDNSVYFLKFVLKIFLFTKSKCLVFARFNCLIQLY